MWSNQVNDMRIRHILLVYTSMKGNALHRRVSMRLAPLGTPWTISGPGQPLHVPAKGFRQLAATAPMDQGMHRGKDA